MLLSLSLYLNIFILAIKTKQHNDICCIILESLPLGIRTVRKAALPIPSWGITCFSLATAKASSCIRVPGFAGIPVEFDRAGLRPAPGWGSLEWSSLDTTITSSSASTNPGDPVKFDGPWVEAAMPDCSSLKASSFDITITSSSVRTVCEFKNKVLENVCKKDSVMNTHSTVTGWV